MRARALGEVMKIRSELKEGVDATLRTGSLWTIWKCMIGWLMRG